jgi:hypothetical protein
MPKTCLPVEFDQKSSGINSEYMATSVLDLISNLRKPRSREAPERSHSMLTGINQKVFLKEWGEPEAQLSLNQLGELERLGTIFLVTNHIEETPLSVWVYKKKKSILLFAKEKLISHFSCKKLTDPIQPPSRS